MQKDLFSFDLRNTRAGTPEDVTVTGIRVVGKMPRVPRNPKYYCCLADAEEK